MVAITQIQVSPDKRGANRMKQQVVEIIAAYVRKNQVEAAQLPALIASVSQSLASLGQPPTIATVPLTPAVSIRQSVGADAITCLDCGAKAKMLKRHLLNAHGLTPDQYRVRWSLRADYPLVAKNYAARRSVLAKAAGLGRRGRSST
jgi:predicted transcriptional regulator